MVSPCLLARWKTVARTVCCALIFATLGLARPTLAAEGDAQPLRIVIVMGENVYYEKEIVEGFLQHLEPQLSAKGIELKQWKFVPDFSGSAYASPGSAEGKEVWERTIGQITHALPIANNSDIDYFVTLGTFASMAIKGSNLMEQYHAKGLIYLGVTSPERAELVGLPKITGVQYGSGGTDFGRKIHEIFPLNQKLVFVYQAEKGKGNVQDEYVADEFKKLNSEYAERYPKARSPRFEIRPIDGLINVENLIPGNPADPDNSEVYIGWYGLDNVLAHTNSEHLRETNLWIVPSNNTPQNLDLAGVIVTADDRYIGEQGARIILKHLAHPTADLGKERYRKSRFKVFIKRDVLEKKGVKLLDEAFKRQEDVTYTYR